MTLDVVCRYLSLFLLYINTEIGKNSCEMLDWLVTTCMGNRCSPIDRHISFYSQNIYMVPHKPKLSYRYLKSGNEEFHRKFVSVPADKAANNVVVV